MATQTISQVYRPDLVDGSRIALGNLLQRGGYASLCAFVFVMPFEDYLQVFGGISMGLILGTLTVGLVALRIAITRQYRLLSPLHYWMAAFVAWATCSLFWTIDWNLTATRTGTYLQLLVVVFVIWELATTEARVFGLLRCYVGGALMASLFLLINYMLGLTAREVYEAAGEETWNDNRYTIAGLNENDLGLILALSMPIALYLVAQRKGWWTTSLGWLTLAACVPSLLLTGSRGGLLAASPTLIMLVLVLIRLPYRQKLVALIACGGVFAATMYFVPDRTWDRVFTLTTEFSGGTFTHRRVIWAAGMEVFRDHALLGVGAGAHSAAILQAVDVPYVAHNSFLSVLVELGVIGELILGALLASMVYCVLRLRSSLDRWMWISFLLVWGIGVSALTWEYRKPTWFMFAALAAHAYARSSYAERVWRSQ